AQAILDDVYAERPRTIAQLDMAALERCCAALGLRPAFSRASDTPVDGAKTDRLIALLVPRGATRYVSGLGALDYLDAHQLGAHGIDVRVMQYTRRPYPQLHGPFDPHMSILDAIANHGPRAAWVLESEAIPWDDAVAASLQVAG
ncbi:MAG TPA: WbqC family protein, partial [Candidatus Elarobacter sp.]|nr:WbqC family protein [Candidatus Elarobacter sp.]